MIELSVQQGSAEWHAARAKCFNASEAPAIMGASKYMTRTELLRQKATGIVQEVDAAKQRLFDSGHEAEANARPLVEALIGEELYPIVATTDDGRFLASSDGATMLCDIGFEHKLWNAEIAAMVADGFVPDSHKWQLDHQFLVFGFEKIIFVCSDGTPENFASCWYFPQPERIKQLIAGWEQFAKDLADYQHTEAKPAVVADAIDDLPALTVQLVGQVTSSNLAPFKEAVLARIKAINTTLVTDADFSNADKMVKFLDDGEKRLDLVKSQALAQTESIDLLFRTIDSLKAEMRSKRLTLDKLVKAEKENRKSEIVTAASKELFTHMQSLRQRVGGYMPNIEGPIFAEAIKGLKSLDSMRDKVSVALANAKIEANAIADRIDANRKTVDDMGLFPDFSAVCTKAPDDFSALLAMRINARNESEAKRLEAERERIRAEEQAKAQSEAAEAIARKNAEDVSVEPPAQYVCIPAPVANVPVCNTDAIPIPTDTGKTIKLGEICARLGFTVTADFIASLGINPVATEKNAKLYSESKFPTICRLISDHVMSLAFKKAS